MDADRLSVHAKVALLVLMVFAGLLLLFCMIGCPYLVNHVCQRLRPPMPSLPKKRRRGAVVHFESQISTEDIDSLDESSINDELRRTMSNRT